MSNKRMKDRRSRTKSSISMVIIKDSGGALLSRWRDDVRFDAANPVIDPNSRILLCTQPQLNAPFYTSKTAATRSLPIERALKMI